MMMLILGRGDLKLNMGSELWWGTWSFSHSPLSFAREGENVRWI